MKSFMLTFIWLLAVSSSNAANTLKFANYYTSHMVLQKEPQRAVLWGYATTIGDTVRVTLNGSNVATAKVTTNTEGGGGVWITKLPPQNAGGPYTISIMSQDGNVTLMDVMFGDVWVCSGQSNMEFNMFGIYNHTEEIAEASNFDNIRIFKIRPTESSTERQDVVPLFDWMPPVNAGGFSAVCLLYAMELAPHVNRPIGLIEADWGGTPVEAWSSPDARSACSQRQKRNPTDTHVLWNAMIRPLLQNTIYGAIWYQGEANAFAINGAEDYVCSFPAMIDDWRQKFHQKSMGETSLMFPFGFVQVQVSDCFCEFPWCPLFFVNVTDFQLAALDNSTAVGAFPALRWAQTAKYGYVPNQKLQNVFMAVAMDLPDFSSPWGYIHPRDKLDVAQRLALASRAVAYAESYLNYQGPLPTSLDVSPGSLTIQYQNSAIEVRDTTRGFEICCGSTPIEACSIWYPTPIVAMTTTSVTLKTTMCDGARNKIAGVRYAWRSSPCEFKKCAIYGSGSNLPGPPFIKTGPF